MIPHGKIFIILIFNGLVVYTHYGTVLLKIKLFVGSFSLDRQLFVCTLMCAQIMSVQEQNFTVVFELVFAKVD